MSEESVDERCSADSADERSPGQCLSECRDFLTDLVGGAAFEGRAIDHARELIANAEAALATFTQPQPTPVSSDEAELLRHQRILVAQDALIGCPSFADFHKSPRMCAMDCAEAVIDALALPRPKEK